MRDKVVSADISKFNMWIIGAYWGVNFPESGHSWIWFSNSKWRILHSHLLANVFASRSNFPRSPWSAITLFKGSDHHYKGRRLVCARHSLRPTTEQHGITDGKITQRIYGIFWGYVSLNFYWCLPNHGWLDMLAPAPAIQMTAIKHDRSNCVSASLHNVAQVSVVSTKDSDTRSECYDRLYKMVVI